MDDLSFRLALVADHARLKEMIIESFEPITWFKKVDETYGPLNGCDWRRRWEKRVDAVFRTEIVLVGEAELEIAACATGTFEQEAALGFIDLLAVDQRRQGRGYGRAMLRGMLGHFQTLGARYAHLDCLTDNEAGNGLYEAEGWNVVATSNRYFIELDAAKPR